MNRRGFFVQALVVWFGTVGFAAAQQVPVPVVINTTPGRVSLVANGGAAVGSGNIGGAMGLVVTADLTARLALEGLGTFTMSHRGTDNQTLTASLLIRLAPRVEPVIPYLAAGIGLYRSSFDLDRMGFGQFFKENPGYSGMMPLPRRGFGMMRGDHDVAAAPRFDRGNVPDFYARRMGMLTIDLDGRFGMRAFVDPAFSLGGGVQLAVGRHVVVRPDARALIVLANGDHRTVGLVTLGLGYRF